MIRRATTCFALLCGCAAIGGCVDWLEMDDPEEHPTAGVTTRWRPVARLPEQRARVDGKGPIVPATPGLRVPDGYFARVRLQVADFLLPYCWASFIRGEGQVSLRLYAIGGPAPVGPLEGSPPPPVLRGLIPITLPSGTGIDTLAGLTLLEDSLEQSMMSLLLENGDQYLVAVERLTFERIGRAALSFTLEGRGSRGSKAERWLPVEMGVIALRAPTVGIK